MLPHAAESTVLCRGSAQSSSCPHTFLQYRRFRNYRLALRNVSRASMFIELTLAVRTGDKTGRNLRRNKIRKRLSSTRSHISLLAGSHCIPQSFRIHLPSRRIVLSIFSCAFRLMIIIPFFSWGSRGDLCLLFTDRVV